MSLQRLQIYFCGSIRGGRDDARLYQKIIQNLKEYGTVLTEHVGSPNQSVNGGVGGPDEGLSAKEIHDRDLEWLKKCDVVVAEVTVPSLGVGYEIGRSLDMGKSILCLFRTDAGRNLSAMIEGAQNKDNELVVRKYQGLEEALSHISAFLKANECQN